MTKAAPEFLRTQEVRFSPVMYGGSSICIYLKGVAQEFLRLVKATATAPAGPPGSGATEVSPPDEDARTEGHLSGLLRTGPKCGDAQSWLSAGRGRPR